MTKFPSLATPVGYTICPHPHQCHNSDKHVNGRPRLQASLAAFSRMPINSLQILPVHYGSYGTEGKKSKPGKHIEIHLFVLNLGTVKLPFFF